MCFLFNICTFLWLFIIYVKHINSEYVCTSPLSNNLKITLPKKEFTADNGVFKELRIIKEYTESYENLGHSQEMKAELIDKAVDYWSKALGAADARDEELQVSKQCVGGGYQVVATSGATEGGGYCETGCETEFTCGGIPIPEKFLQCKKMVNGVPTIEKSDEANTEIADFLLLVDHRAGEHCEGNTLVYAGTCVLNAERNRPEVGYINFCKDIGSMKFPNNFLGYQAVRHQLGHALGFNAAMFAYMRDGNGHPRTPRDDSGHPHTDKVDNHFKTDENTVKQTVLSWYSEVYTGARWISILRTSNALTAAKDHFDCQDLEGIELEDVGVKNNHFKRRVVMDELMSATTTVNSKVSALTLGYFADSGWYKVNMDKVEKWTWGAGLGCNFVKKSCYEYMQLRLEQNFHHRPWCTDIQSMDTECLTDNSAFGTCNLVEYPQPLAAMFQYFPASGEYGPTFGGSDEYADYCPYIKVAENDCMAKTTLCTSEENTVHEDFNVMFQTYGNASLCLNHHTSQPWEYSGFLFNRTFISRMASCHEYECSPLRGIVIIINYQHFPCGNGLREIPFDIEEYGTRLVGSFICPSCSSICDECPVDN